MSRSEHAQKHLPGYSRHRRVDRYIPHEYLVNQSTRRYTLPNEKPFRFEDLPVEIQIHILSFTEFVTPRRLQTECVPCYVDACQHRIPHLSLQALPLRNCSLLQVSRSVRAMALQLYFSRSDFIIKWDPHRASDLMHKVNEAAFGRIQRLHIVTGRLLTPKVTAECDNFIRFLGRLTNSKELKLSLYINFDTLEFDGMGLKLKSSHLPRFWSSAKLEKAKNRFLHSRMVSFKNLKVLVNSGLVAGYAVPAHEDCFYTTVYERGCQ